MIGVFDSGSGWLTFLEAARKLLPEYDFLYLGDYENCPYGNKNSEEIYTLSRNWVLKLKEAWANLVILACNTAVSNAIKPLQLEEKKIGIKVLWVTIPWAEKVVEAGYKHICVLATASSVKNWLYKDRVHILDREVSVEEIALPDLALLVEKYLSGYLSKEYITDWLQKNIHIKNPHTEAIVIGCTHYSHLYEIFKKLYPHYAIIDPSREAAIKLVQYLKRHGEIDAKLTKWWKYRDISLHQEL